MNITYFASRRRGTLRCVAVAAPSCSARGAGSWQYAISLSDGDDATLADHREAVETIDSVAKSWKRVFGDLHPETPSVQSALENARKKLAAASAAASESQAPP